MGRALIILASQTDKDKARVWVQKAPWNTRVTFQGPKRTLPQNDRLWAMLTDVAQQATWAGEKRAPEEWKDLFTGAVKSASTGLKIVPGLTGGFMILGLHTSDMDKQEMGELLDYIASWGAQNGVTFQEPKE